MDHNPFTRLHTQRAIAEWDCAQELLKRHGQEKAIELIQHTISNGITEQDAKHLVYCVQVLARENLR